MLRIAAGAVFAIVALIFVRLKRRKNAPPPNPLTLTPYDSGSTGPDTTDAGDRSPLSPDDPELSGGAAKRLGEEDPA
jgi:hypothetical protein